MEVRQLSLALGKTAAEGLAFRLAVESAAAADGPAVQLRLIKDDGMPDLARLPSGRGLCPLSCPRRKAVGAPQRPQSTLL